MKKEFEDDIDEDKCIEVSQPLLIYNFILFCILLFLLLLKALLSEGCVFHNSNYEQDNGDVEQTNIVSSR